MGNLGTYQLMTTIAKKVGGPINLAGALLVGGIAIGFGLAKSRERIVNKDIKLKSKNMTPKILSTIYTVSADGTDNSGLKLIIGDKFRVLERDGDLILIEIIGDLNSPYFIHDEFLISVSETYAQKER